MPQASPGRQHFLSQYVIFAAPRDQNNTMYKILYSYLLAFSCLIHSCAPVKNSATREQAFYSIQDFDSIEKFDSHIHLNTMQTAFIEQAAADKVSFLDIVDDRPFGINMYEQQKIAVAQTNSFPQQIFYATTFAVKDFNKPGWTASVIKSLDSAFADGAVAVKVWKNVGMDLKDEHGKFVMIDHPRFDSILSYLERLNVPLIGHLGEPRECWLPLDSMVLHKSYYAAHPEYHMYLHPEYPSYEQQVQARDNMLAKHTRLKFIGAHLGSVEWSIDELATRLDKFPNMAVDLARLSNLFLHAKTDLQKTKDFFIKYQDRLLYATDVQVAETDDPATLKKRAHDARLRQWTFFATDTKMEEPNIGAFSGLKLPKQVIDKIYRLNALAWLRLNK
jgi:predicted TIM-barrel fold metal-dependent hydrolase